MSLNINNVILAGHLTRDPEIRFLANENAVANFGIAVNRKFKDKDKNLAEEVTFIDCEAWGRTAELIGQYLTKGRPIYLEGRLKLDTWQDKDGQKRTKIKVVVDNVQFIGAKPATDDHAAPGVDAKAETAAIARPAKPADEPPF